MPDMLPPMQSRWTPFAYGFRPFFLAALWYAFLVIPSWLWIWREGFSPVAALPAFLWHGHEMLFGFVIAAIAGFLLTAVPSWTGIRGFAGRPLQVLSALWLAGRAVFALAAILPAWMVAVADLAFLPGLIACLARPLLRERNRNTPLLFVLVVLWLTDICFNAGVVTGNAELARRALLAGLDIVLLLITVIAGRIVPAFTANALRSRSMPVTVHSAPFIERSVIAVMALNVVVDAVGLPAPAGAVLAATVALAAGLLHGLRMARWQGLSSFRQPIVWILHAGYAWLAIGFLLKAMSLGAGVPWAAYWLHALGIGVAATLIVAVVTRASLGHTGRPLVTPGPAVAGYGLLIAAALVRVFAPAVLPDNYFAVIATAGVLWSAAFALIAIPYTPILLQPRADRRPG